MAPRQEREDVMYETSSRVSCSWRPLHLYSCTVISYSSDVSAMRVHVNIDLQKKEGIRGYGNLHTYSKRRF